MRVTDPKELEALLKKGRVNPRSMATAQAFLKETKSASSKAKKATVCEYPPMKEPSAVLYHRIVGEYGRFDEGGMVLHEVRLPFTGSRIRLDMAIPAYRLAIEVDGWQYHGKYLESFKKDRAKQLLLAEFGWLVIRLSNEQIKKDIESVMQSIAACIRHAPHYAIDPNWVEPDGFGRHSVSTNPIQTIEKRSSR